MKKLIITRIKQISDCCPSQWYATTDDNNQVYIRYRYGLLDVRVDKNDPVLGESYLLKEYGDEWNGTLSTSELISITKDNIVWKLKEE